ncbi:SusC/RagA family TonB-linked outer membrane protein [Reichenbachiella carrageenanivorans]|uniref:SusC/RagA family TonB-linked outer membrane protein n=1 Tax=Reichenbachiella carrageenanivorans TaxID=2979869 RepID=A0ABY6D2M5_9BACT|nr:SusC/RagA family TonB-linked outer membrane protein [Reichenbachiella carrageenanivorans]UXX79875.1 SusC/RagA family TonB-linked outer membrane protein [Reichenbachiella carrageenanivorans]
MDRTLLKILLVCLILTCHQSLLAQHKVTGTVYDNSGPLIGATVQLENSAVGVICDIDGNFSIEVPDENASIKVSFVGYEPQTVFVGTRTRVDVSLILNVNELEEVVVSALGFEQKKDNLGSTSSVVKTEELLRSGETTIINSLSGKVAGVKVTRGNGDPGAGASIQIRGQNTIGGSTQPLIIVDGVPLANNSINGAGNGITGGSSGGTSQQSRLNDINPNDIESMQVLKGASAASLWGSRAANGVIVITTKRGKSGRPKIEYNATYSLDEINVKHPMQSTYGQGANGAWDPTARNSWGDRIADRSGTPDEVDFFGEYFEAADGTLYYPIVSKNSQETYVDRNFDQVFQRGHFFQQDLSISGGGDKSTFFFSFGKLDQEGIIRNSDYNRYNVRLNGDTRFNDWLSMSAKASYTNTNSNRIQQNSNVSGMYVGLLRSAPDFNNADYIGTYYDGLGGIYERRQRAYRNQLGQNEDPIYTNPQWATDEQLATTQVDRFTITPQINVDPLDWLGFTFRGGADVFTDTREYFFPKNSASAGRKIGVQAQDILTRKQLNFDAITKMSFNLNKDIGLQTTLGWNITQSEGESFYMHVENFEANTDFATFELVTNQNFSSLSKTAFITRSNRGYAQASVDLYDQVFVNVNGALEAASTIADNFFYPSTDVAWQFTRLPIFNNQNILSFGKIRGSWGKVGIRPSAHRSQTLTDGGFSVSTYNDALDVSVFGGGFRLDDDQGNDDLRPEVKTEYEAGADFRFLKDKLNVSFTYYYNKIEDILLDIAKPASTGFTNIYMNAGSMENRGVELELDYQLLRTPDWSINVSANFNRNRNEVLSLYGAESVNLTGEAISSRAVVGEPLGVLWANKAERNEDGTLALDANGFPLTDVLGGVVGDPNPEWRGGAALDLRWKNLKLNLLFEHSHGGQFADRTRMVLYGFGTHADVGNDVTLGQDVRNLNGQLFTAGTTVRGNVADFGAGPVLLDEAWYTTKGGGFGSGVIYELLISEDASWTKLREVSLGYTLNTPWLQETLKLSSVEFTATGRNLALWTDIIGIDPETSQFGVNNGFGTEYFTNPSSRSVLFSVKITY